MEEIILRGKIDSEGELLIYGLRDLKKFSKSQIKRSTQEGVNILVKITVLSDEKKDRMFGYVKAKMIPEIRKAMYNTGTRMTDHQVECMLLEIAEIDCRKRLSDLNYVELYNLIDTVKQYAAENLSLYVDDALII